MRTILSIFFTFFKVGALTFGGGYAMLPILQREVVGKKEWVSYEEVTDYYAVAQCLPGIIAVNTSMLIGHKYKGKPGMLAAAFGVVFPSLIVILVIAMFIQNLLQYEMAVHAFNGIRVAVLALVIGAVYKMWKSGVKDWIGIIIFAASLLLMFLDISPILPVVGGALCGIAVKRIKERKTE